MDKRQQANREIVKHVQSVIEEHPELRFHQILWHLNIEDGTDQFYEESTATLARLQGSFTEQNNIEESLEL